VATEARTDPATGHPTVPGAAPPTEADPNRWLALACVLTATFMILLDVSIVIVAIPPIQHNLGATSSQIQLVLAGYQLAYAVMLITGGRLGDIHGRKRLFMIGMSAFVVASALCGLAPNPTVLVGARVLQGLGASLMYPQVLSVIQVSFLPAERNKAFGIFGAVIGLATITGPLAGGLIVRDDTTGSSWRWIFLVNVPIGIASLLLAWRFLRESRAPQASRLDLAGVVLVSAGLGLLVYPLVEGRQLGWPAWSYVSLALSPVVLAVFILYERRRQGSSPLLQLSLFANRSFAAGVLLAAVFFAGVPAFFFTFSLMLQNGLGFTALHAGLTTVPFAVGSAIASGMSVRLAPRLGRVILLIGNGLLVAGITGVIVLLGVFGENLSTVELLPALFVAGLGLGAVVAPLLTLILAGVSGREAGSASGLLTSTQQVGGAIGVAIIGVIFFGLLGSRAGGVAEGVAPQLRNDVAGAARRERPEVSASSAERLAGAVVDQFQHCFVDRANAVDPTLPPPSCAAPPGRPPLPAVTQAVGSSTRVALGRDFTGSLQRALIFDVAVWGASIALVFGLPRTVRRPVPPV